jgi:hypothetical protein
MQTHTDKRPETKSNAVANNLTAKPRGAQTTPQLQPGRSVIQKVGPEYSGPSREKRHMGHFIEWWNVVAAPDSTGHARDPQVILHDRAELVRQEMPAVPFSRILTAVTTFQHDGYEAIWKSILSQCTDKELEGMAIAGRSSQWQLLPTELGRGSEATVYWGFKFGGGSPVAIKVFRGTGDLHETAFRKEIDAHRLLKEFEQKGAPIPNVVRMLDYNTYLKAVVMEHALGYPLDKLEAELTAHNNRKFRMLDTPTIDIKGTMEKMTAKKAEAIKETQGALRTHGYQLGDLQDRNIMYNYMNNKITFVDISLEEI